MFDKLKEFGKGFIEFWGPLPATEHALFEHWICQGVAADGTEFEHEGGWVLVSGLTHKDGIRWLMDKVTANGYFRDAHVVFPLATVVSADWQKVETLSGPIPYDQFDFQIDFTRSQVLEKLAEGKKLSEKSKKRG